MKTIAILNPKGGSGKTTLTTNLARGLYERGLKILLVDSDPQGSARDWHAADDANPVPLVALDRANNIRNIKGLGKDYDAVLIDGAAKLEDMLAATIKAADHILIPVQPSPYDLWAASDLVDFIKVRQEITDGQPTADFVVTRTIAGTKLGKDIRAALDEYGLGLCRSAVAQRQAYPQTASEGRTVFDGTNAAARDEIAALAEEIHTRVIMGEGNGTQHKAA